MSKIKEILVTCRTCGMNFVWQPPARLEKQCQCKKTSHTMDTIPRDGSVIISDELTPDQRQQIEGVLARKWGLEGSLPYDHPYKPPPDNCIVIREEA